MNIELQIALCQQGIDFLQNEINRHQSNIEQLNNTLAGALEILPKEEQELVEVQQKLAATQAMKASLEAQL